LVGSRFGVGPLGLYAVILSVSVMPTSLIHGAASKLAMSFLVFEERSVAERSENYRTLVALFSIIGMLYALFVALTLDWLLPYIFGPTFTINSTIHILFVIIVYLRIQRGGAPTTLLLVAGRTGELALLNISSGLGLVVAFALTSLRPRFEGLLLGVLIGDLISFILFFVSTGRIVGRGCAGYVESLVGLAALLLIVGALSYAPSFTWQARGAVLGVGLLAVGAQCAFEFYKNTRLRDLMLNARKGYKRDEHA
jgi:hypothetical protein